MKKLIEKYKKIFDTKRKKAVLKLALWILFFVIVLNMVGRPPKNYYKNSENSNKEVKLSASSIDNFKNMSNYEYTYNIEFKKNDTVQTFNIDGTYYNNKYYFNMDNKSYYISDEVIYLVNNDEKKIIDVKSILNNGIFNVVDLRIFRKDNLYTFIDSSTEESNTSYKDGTEVKKYSYVTSEGKKMDITTSSSGKLINSIVLDLTNYIDIKYDSVKATLNLKNINNISSYKVNYDEYQVIKKEGE